MSDPRWVPGGTAGSPLSDAPLSERSLEQRVRMWKEVEAQNRVTDRALDEVADEIAALEQHSAEQHEGLRQATVRIAELEQERDRLLLALYEFGSHDEICAGSDMGPVCTCGYTAALGGNDE